VERNGERCAGRRENHHGQDEQRRAAQGPRRTSVHIVLLFGLRADLKTY
jgi:hypothetical protein